MDAQLEAKLRLLVDKSEIREVITRYCRAVDRCDAELLRSCYWPDGRDNHGFFCGGVDAFIDYIMPVLTQALSTTHAVSNVLLEVDGDRACGESYVHVTHRLARADGTLVDNKSNCRYVDLFERRNGEWRILFRSAVLDTMYDEPVTVLANMAAFAGNAAKVAMGRHDKDDPAYLRFAAQELDGPDFAMKDFWKAVLSE